MENMHRVTEYVHKVYEAEQDEKDNAYRDSVYADELARQDYDDAFSRWQKFGYIRNQKEHHKRTSFAEEYRTFLEENGLEVNEKYFLKD